MHICLVLDLGAGGEGQDTVLERGPDGQTGQEGRRPVHVGADATVTIYTKEVKVIFISDSSISVKDHLHIDIIITTIITLTCMKGLYHLSCLHA